MTQHEESGRSAEEPAEQGAESPSQASQGGALSHTLAGPAALAGIGLLAQALASERAEAAEPTTLEATPVKLQSIDNGISVEVSSKELAQHLAREGVIDPKHKDGVAAILYRLTFSP